MNQKYALLLIVVVGVVGLGAWNRWASPLSGFSQTQTKNRSLTAINERVLQVTDRMLVTNTHNGERLYMGHCASCHGKDLEGESDWKELNPDGSLKAPPHDDSGHSWHHDDKLLFEYTKKGGKALMEEAGITNFQSGMPAFGQTLLDQEIADVLAFIKSHWSERSSQVQRQRTEAASAVGDK